LAIDLEDYQKEGVLFLRSKKRCILADETGLGKEQPMDARILTPTGWVTMGELKVGSRVIGQNGRSCRVTGVFPQGIKPVYKVTFADGASVECGEDHLWSVNSSVRRFRGSPSRVLSLKQLVSIGLRDASGKRKWSIPMVRPIVFEESCSPLPVDPYLLGALLGNGGLKYNVAFSTGDIFLKEKVQSILTRDFPTLKLNYVSGVDYRISGCKQGRRNPLKDLLSYLGIYGKGSAEKFIPERYLLASSPEDRLALLHGLFDCDSYVMPGTSTLEWTTASKEMVKGVKFLVQSLGGTLRESKTKVVNGKEYPRTTVCLPLGIDPVTTPCKLKNFVERKKYAPSRAIDSVQYVGKKACQCISVDAEDCLYLTNDCVVTHNTVQSLAAAKDLSLPSIVICPKFVASKWVDTARDMFGMEVIGVFGNSKEQRQKALAKAGPNSLIVTNYETVNQKYPELFSREYGAVIIDEAQFLSNRNSSRTKQIKSFCKGQENVWMATASPVWDDIPGIWSLLNILAPKRFSSFWKFVNYHCNVQVGHFGTEINGANEARLPELRATIAEFLLRRKKRDVLDLPPRIEKTLMLDPLKGFKKEYWKIKREMRENGRSKLSRLRAHALDRERFTFLDEAERLHEKSLGTPPKYEALKRILDAEKGKKCLVFVVHSESLQIAKQWLAELEPGWLSPDPIQGTVPVSQREKIIEEFKAHEGGGVLLGTVGTMGTGIDLDFASVVVFLEHPHIYEELQQCIGRVERFTTTEPQMIYHLVQKGTVDERVWKACQGRAKISESVLATEEDS
jgi:hypothetical protein